MATDDKFDSNAGANPLHTLFQTGAVLAPLGFAGYSAFRNIKANAALNPSAVAEGFSGAGNLGEMGQLVGERLREKSVKTSKKSLEYAQKVADELMQTDKLTALWQSASEQNAIVQSLLDTLHDPSLGLNTDVLAGYREKLTNIANKIISSEEARDVIKQTVGAINDSAGADTKIRFAQNLREYRKVGRQLTPPILGLKANAPFQVVDASSLSGAAKARYKQLTSKLGQGSNQYVDLVSHSMNGENQFYARLYEGRPGRSRFLALAPLDLGTTGRPYTTIRMNEQGTVGYRADRRFFDAPKLSDAFKKHGDLLDPGQIQSASVAAEDFFMDELTRRTRMVQGRPFLPDSRDYGAWQRQFLAADARIVSSGVDAFKNSGLAKHLKKAFAFQHNYGQIVNTGKMKREEVLGLATRLATGHGMEAGVSSARVMSSGFGSDFFATVGIYQGSALSQVRSVGLSAYEKIRAAKGLSYDDRERMMRGRQYFPVTSRIEQITGRESMFWQTRERRMGRGGVFRAGAGAIYDPATKDYKVLGGAAGWSDELTGTTNKVVVMDVSGKNFAQGLEGSGVAFGRGKERTINAGTKPLMLGDEANQVLGSKLMNDVIEKANKDELFRISARELKKKYGRFVGIGPNGLQFMRGDPRARDFELAFEVTESAGKRHINVIQTMTRDMEIWKGFSKLFKGTVQRLSRSAAEKFSVYDEAVLGSKGARLATNRDTLYTSGDMLEKAPGFLEHQMTSGYGYFSGQQDWFERLTGYAVEDQLGIKGKPGGGRALGRTTGAVIRGLAEQATGLSDADFGLFSERAGLVLGGVFDSKKGGKWLDRPSMESAVIKSFGEERGKAVIAQASRGLALGVDAISQGMGPGDWGIARGSVETRFFQNLQHKLKRMGLSSAEVADTIASIYQGKPGHARHLKAAGAMLNMAAGVRGLSGPLDELRAMGENVKTLSLADMKLLNVEESLTKALTEHPQGFILDLASDAGVQPTKMTAHRALAATAMDVFGTTRIPIAGAEAMDAMRDTLIKTTDSTWQSVDNEYSQTVRNFARDLFRLSESSAKAQNEATKSFQVFQENVTTLASKVIHGVTRGKVAGLQAHYGAVLDLTAGTGASPENLQLARDIFKRTKGMSVYFDSNAFNSQLGDFMGTGGLSKTEAARMAEKFYTSVESAKVTGSVTDVRGIASLATRHPILGPGHVEGVQIFRHLEEVGRGAGDNTFKAFAGTKRGGAVIQRLGVSSFGDVAKLGDAQRSQFFKAFVSNMGDFSGIGGGASYIPRMMQEVLYGGDKVQVDMGIAGSMIGDWDGDYYHFTMLRKDASQKIMSTLGQGKSEAWTQARDAYKMKFAILAGEAKTGLKNLGESIGTTTADEYQLIRESLLKEAASKNVGPLDMRLNQLRSAALDMRMGDPVQKTATDNALAMLGIVQEHAVLKGKKLDVYRPFAEKIVSGVDALVEGDETVLRNVLATEIFPGTQFISPEGARISGMGRGPGESDEAWKASVAAAGEGRLQLDDVMATLKRSVGISVNRGGIDMVSAARMGMAMGSEDPVAAEAAFNILSEGMTQEAGLIKGFAGDTLRNVTSGAENMMSRIRGLAGGLSNRTMGIAAAGLGASALLGSMLMGNNQPEPLMSSSGGSLMRDSMTTGGMLRGDQVGPRPENMSRPSDPYAMMNRPINTGTMFSTMPTSYAVHGQIPSSGGINNFSPYMQGMTGGNAGGSIRINDGRRPITSNYVDRLLGEY